MAVAFSDLALSQLSEVAKQGYLFAILDSCDSPEIISKVDRLGPELALCLYRGDLEPELREIAPFLIQVNPALLSWIESAIWAEPWGIFIISRESPKTLLRHFRHFLIVRDEDGEDLYFRFYDPRVIPTFLSSCNEEESEKFFGPVTYLAFIDHRTNSIRLASRSEP